MKKNLTCLTLLVMLSLGTNQVLAQSTSTPEKNSSWKHVDTLSSDKGATHVYVLEGKNKEITEYLGFFESEEVKLPSGNRSARSLQEWLPKGLDLMGDIAGYNVIAADENSFFAEFIIKDPSSGKINKEGWVKGITSGEKVLLTQYIKRFN